LYVPDAPPADGRLPISVIIPTYNRAELVQRALKSVFAQRPALAAEVLVIDDGSTDESANVAESMGARVIRHSENKGLAAARNTGVKEATQPWVALLDSDDEWLPHHLTTLWGHHEGHVLVAGSALYCGADPARDRVHGTSRGQPLVLSSPSPLVFPDNQVPVSASMVRRDTVRAVGGFKAYKGVVEDLDLWLRVLNCGTGVIAPTVTLIYHVHEDQMSRDHMLMHRAHIAVSESYAEQGWWSSTLVERWRGRSRWDQFRLALDEPRPLVAMGHLFAIFSHPQRAVGVLGTWSRRLLIRRRSSAVARDGGPSVALLPDGPPPDDALMRRIALRPVVDLRERRSFLSAWLRLMRRPTGFAVARSPVQAVLLRALGIRALRPEKDARHFTRWVGE
jgi:GT2 family glycosyltransferase